MFDKLIKIAILLTLIYIASDVQGSSDHIKVMSQKVEVFWQWIEVRFL